jgi:hypothetical protein
MKYDIMRVSPVAAIWQLHEAALKPDAFEPSIAAGKTNDVMRPVASI